MNLSSLTAISPIDGRYRKTTENLDNYFSEFALIKYRVKIEIDYFIQLSNVGLPQLPKINNELVSKLKTVYENFSIEDALKIKETEKTTNHDVKAVEYFVKEKLSHLGLEKYLEFVHFGLTSQDINNTSIPLSLKDATNTEIIPILNQLINTLIDSCAKH